MPFISCIQRHVNSGLIKSEQAKKLEAEYNDLVNQYTGSMGDAVAAAKAAYQLISIKSKKIAEKKASDIIAARFQINVGREIDARTQEKKTAFNRLGKAQQKLLSGFAGKPSVSETVRDFLDVVAANQEHVIAQLQLPLTDLFKKKPWLFENGEFNELMRDAVSHALGKQASTAEARSMGDALRKSFDLAHQMFTVAGGVIGRIQNYFPVSHNSDRFAALEAKIGSQAAFNQWEADILPLLDRSKMINETTGLPFTDAELKIRMQEDFETIKSDGLNKINRIAEAGGQLTGTGSTLQTSRDHSRFYQFLGADEFLEYNNKYGPGNENLFETATSYLSSMGRDIGTMQKMGPKPHAVMRNLNLRMTEDSPQSKYWTNSIYDTINGSLSSGGKDPAWYRVYQANRNLMRASMLGSATLGAIGDPFFAKLMARRHGLPGFKLLDNIKTIREEGGIDSQSIRQFLTATDYLAGSSVSRFGEDLTSFGQKALSKAEIFAAKSADFTHRASGLNYWTAIQETASTMAVEGSTFHASSKSWDKLAQEHRDALSLFGINNNQWDIIRAAQPKVVGRHQAKYIGATDVASQGNGTAIREAAINYGAYVRGLANQAVNKPSARTRGIQTGGQQAGTVLRAFISSATQFKGFAFTVMFNFALPALQQMARGNFRDIGWLMAGTIPIGALAIQLREIAKGNDPRPMDNTDFWKAAALQSGGLGPFGDFLFAEHGRFGRSPLIDMILGPTGGQIDDIRRITLGNFERALSDESYDGLGKFTSDVYKFATYHIPGQNLWYARNMVEAITDAPLNYFDPNYESKREKRIQKQNKDFGNKPYWMPGEFLPDRLPGFN